MHIICCIVTTYARVRQLRIYAKPGDHVTPGAFLPKTLHEIGCFCEHATHYHQLRSIMVIRHDDLPLAAGGSSRTFTCAETCLPRTAVRRLPTFAGAQPTIIGLDGFHFCVRNGNRWDTISIAALQLYTACIHTLIAKHFCSTRRVVRNKFLCAATLCTFRSHQLGYTT